MNSLGHDIFAPCLDCGIGGTTGCVDCAHANDDGRCCCGAFQLDDTSLDDGDT